MPEQTLLRAKYYEKKSYDEGYSKGMEDAINQNFAHTVKKPIVEDILAMLYIIHSENMCILGKQGETKTAMEFDNLLKNEIESYKHLKEPDSE